MTHPMYPPGSAGTAGDSFRCRTDDRTPKPPHPRPTPNEEKAR